MNKYFSDYCTRIHWFLNNAKLENYRKKFQEIDSLYDYELFKKEVVNFKDKTNITAEYKCINKESLYYGHAYALSQYANLDDMELVYYPHIEHGINFSHDTIDFQLAKKIPAFIFQGKYKKYMVQEVSKRTPVFCIGPYIQYAQDYYESDKISKLRSLNGSTVTMFPTHTYEKSHSRYHREDFVNTTMSKYKERFHTIQVCVYWNDIDDPIYRMFQEKGAKLVSAGMRFDYKFLSRLKTIIELSDCIAGNDIGTYLGYALSLGKKISFIDSEIEEYDQNVISNMSLISKEKKRRIANSILLKDENIMLNELDPYWGLSIPQYSPDEMKMMLYFVKAIVQNSHGKTDRFKISTQNVFNEWINGSRGQIEFIRSRLGFDLNS